MTGTGKHSKFVEIATKRVNRACKSIELIGQLSNRKRYEYSQEESQKVIEALTAAVAAVEGQFAAPKQSGFSFS